MTLQPHWLAGNLTSEGSGKADAACMCWTRSKPYISHHLEVQEEGPPTAIICICILEHVLKFSGVILFGSSKHPKHKCNVISGALLLY